MRRYIPIGAALIVGVGIGGGAARTWDKAHWPPNYTRAREQFVRVQVATRGPVETLFLGDSITEETLLDGVCGTNTNAAAGGAMVNDVERIARYAIPITRPKRIVVAVGINNFHHGRKERAVFKAHYVRLLDALPRVPTILVGVVGKPEASAFVQAQAKRIGATYIPPVEGAAFTVPDRVHLTVAGVRLYRQRLDAACRAHPVHAV